MKKITIVGAGNVGSQAAFYGAIKKLGHIVLTDIIDGLPQGKALDILESMPVAGSDAKITGTNNYADTKGSDIAVVTAGVPRKPGMSRDDLIEINSAIIKAIVPEIVKYSPNCILIIVTNPLDAMVQLAYKVSGFDKQKVIGMAGVLDTTRLKAFLADELNESVKKIEAMVLGGHGDLMVPLLSYCKVNGQPLEKLLPQNKIDGIFQRVRDGGLEIVKLLKTGSAFFAPGLSIIAMVESILKDQKKVLPCSVLLEGEYDTNGAFAGVPVRLGKNGAEEIIELELSPQEKSDFNKSISHIKEITQGISKNA